MNIQVFMLKQDDPKKCTAAKLIKFGLARGVSKTQGSTIILDPFAPKTILRQDAAIAKSITGIDCSWNLAETAFARKFQGIPRKLPPLLAGNPVNYSKLNKLTTVEAIAAAAFILGYGQLAMSMLDKFNWGHTFYELNADLLKDYSEITSEQEIEILLAEYGLIDKKY